MEGREQSTIGENRSEGKRGGDETWSSRAGGCGEDKMEEVCDAEHGEDEREKSARKKSESKNRVLLNVGGKLMETSTQTLCVDSNSMLAAWATRHMKDEGFWIDRDPVRFQHVLNYLRNGTVWLDEISDLRALQEEADFFRLHGLGELCAEKIQEVLEAKAQHEWSLVKQLTERLDSYCQRASQRKEPILGVRRRRLDYGNYNEPVFRIDEDF